MSNLSNEANNEFVSQTVWIKEHIGDLLDESFDVNPGLDPVDFKDGGYPAWMIISQLLEYMNAGNRWMDVKVLIKNDVCGRIEVMTEKVDPQLAPYFIELLDKFRQGCSDLCDSCKGTGTKEYGHPTVYKPCGKCAGSGKLKK